MESLRGTGVALITPFNADLTVDVNGLKRLVNFNIDNGVDYLVVLGTTAENATLTPQEKQVVIQNIVATNNKRVPLVLGIGGNNTALVQEQVADADTLEHIDAILSVSPYYNKPSQEGIYLHYKALDAVTIRPILLYNVPSRTGSNLTPETALRIARDCKNVVGIKEAAGSMDQALRLLKDRPEGFLVLSGDDMMALPMICAGGDGVISVIAQALPASFSGLIGDGLEGAFAKAYQEQYNLMKGIDLIFEEGNPSGIKAMLASLGICQEHVRLPLSKASVALTQKIKEFLKVQV